MIAMIAPSHSHVTSGETISRNVTGHGWLMNRWVRPLIAASRSANSWFSATARPAGGASQPPRAPVIPAVALVDQPLQRPSDGSTTVQMSCVSPASRPIRLSSEPLKNRPIGPSVGSCDGYRPNEVRRVVTWCPPRDTASTAPSEIFWFDAVAVGLT